MPLDRTSPVPLWAQLEAELRRRLVAGEFTQRFPTDRELVDTYKVSRHTARDAVDRLCTDGLLERRRGRGTFIRPEFERPAGAIYSLFRAVEALGAANVVGVVSPARRTSTKWTTTPSRAPRTVARRWRPWA